MIDSDAAERFAPYLMTRETIRWAARPQQGVQFRAADTFLIPFSLLWCGFAIFWEFTASTAPNAPLFFDLWGAMFVCVGLFFVFGRFFVDAFLRSRTYYAVTDQRALILSGGLRSELTAVDLATAGQIRFSPSSANRGSIQFGPDPFPFRSAGIWFSTSSRVPQFFRVEDAQEAYRLVQPKRD